MKNIWFSCSSLSFIFKIRVALVIPMNTARDSMFVFDFFFQISVYYSQERKKKTNRMNFVQAQYTTTTRTFGLLQKKYRGHKV